jgi:hypothetical protein
MTNGWEMFRSGTQAEKNNGKRREKERLAVCNFEGLAVVGCSYDAEKNSGNQSEEY